MLTPPCQMSTLVQTPLYFSFADMAGVEGGCWHQPHHFTVNPIHITHFSFAVVADVEGVGGVL